MVLNLIADKLWMDCLDCVDNIWCNEYDNSHDCDCKCHDFALRIRKMNL